MFSMQTSTEVSRTRTKDGSDGQDTVAAPVFSELEPHNRRNHVPYARPSRSPADLHLARLRYAAAVSPTDQVPGLLDPQPRRPAGVGAGGAQGDRRAGRDPSVRRRMARALTRLALLGRFGDVVRPAATESR